MSNTIELLEKALTQASASFSEKSTISVEEHYIDCLSSDKQGVYVLLEDFNAGMFIIEHDNKLMAFMPKFDDGDSSVGINSSFYNGFECHDADIIERNMTKITVDSYLALIRISMMPMIDNMLEYESLLANEEY